MKLPPNITLAEAQSPRLKLVQLHNRVIGSYERKHSGGGYRWRTVEGAYGDAATAHLSVVAIVETSRSEP